ncbi:uncharacterized protein LOC129608957 [Condylostylus longicornis]|uniref:uncharacterized protein LOC129608957 n=1 Tax=Condylostylus longicornis TaxID=2530218 RepID=UPI00244DCC72|nr:uncharacterized protein LOC129608957 [Condylostylus longicornis]
MGLIGYAIGKDPNNNTKLLTNGQSRQARFFPFYTIGRFSNDLCIGKNLMSGTCVIKGECSDNGGVATGSCSTITKQAVCCVYQQSCGTTTAFNNTYFYNRGYPGTFPGGSSCTLIVEPCDSGICQLRIDFLAFSLAPPNGDGTCNIDYFSVNGGSSRVPRICGENSGSHVYVNFNGENPITLSILTTASFTFNRQWQMQVSQISCNSPNLAPSGCLQYYFDTSGTVQSFNYGSAASSALNSIGLPGTRQIANQQYGICIRMGSNQCSITWSQLSSDPYSFTVTGDVGALDPTLIGTSAVQSQDCTTDYVIIPYPTQNNARLPSDRFCGLGLGDTTSNIKPFVLYVVTDSNEDYDISNRGFALSYSQNTCPIS